MALDIRTFFGKRHTSSPNQPNDDENKRPKVTYAAVYDKTKRERTVKDEWLTIYPWSKFENGELYCDTCRKYPQLSDKKSSLVKGVTVKFKKETLKWHERSTLHKTCVHKDIALNKPDETDYLKCMRKLEDKNIDKYEILFNTAYFIALEGDAFTKFPKLCHLQEVNGLKIGENYLNNVACREFINTIAEEILDSTKIEINNARFISILSDGSTDKAIIEQESVFVRYLVDGKPVTKLAELVALKSGDARGVKEGIFDGLERIGVGVDSLAEKCVCINTDGAEVNMGRKSGAVKQILDTIEEKFNEGVTSEHIAVVHCVAHNLELAILDAKKEVCYLSRFEEIVKGVFKLYFYSPKRRRHLKEIAEQLDKELQHFGGLQQIRWLSSQLRALEALKVNWEVTIVHLEDIASGKDEASARATGLLKEMKTLTFVTFLHFMLDFLSALSVVSQIFQLEDSLVSEVCRTIETGSQKILKLKEKPGKNLKAFQTYYDSESNEFKGVKLSQPQKRKGRSTTNKTTETGESHTEELLQEDMKSLVDNTDKYIHARFSVHFLGDDKPHGLFRVFDYKLWPSEIDKLRNYGDDKIDKLVKLYQPLLSCEEIENAPEEWLDLKMYVNQATEINPIQMYGNLLKSSPENMKNILPLVDIMFCISPSTAACERSFSQMNNIKSELRTSLGQSSLSSLMRIATKGQPLDAFEPMPAINLWLASKNRHLKGHKLHGPRPKAVAGSADSDTDDTD